MTGLKIGICLFFNNVPELPDPDGHFNVKDYIEQQISSVRCETNLKKKRDGTEDTENDTYSSPSGLQ